MNRLHKSKKIKEHLSTIEAIKEQIKAIQEQIRVNTLKASETELKINSTASADELNNLFTIKNNIIQIDQLLHSRIKPLNDQLNSLNHKTKELYAEESKPIVEDITTEYAKAFKVYVDTITEIYKRERELQALTLGEVTPFILDHGKHQKAIVEAIRESEYPYRDTKIEFNTKAFNR
ncbi:MAG: hypothetical protein ACRCX2_20025 [Paraclostridium sp.]